MKSFFYIGGKQDREMFSASLVIMLYIILLSILDICLRYYNVLLYSILCYAFKYREQNRCKVSGSSAHGRMVEFRIVTREKNWLYRDLDAHCQYNVLNNIIAIDDHTSYRQRTVVTPKRNNNNWLTDDCVYPIFTDRELADCYIGLAPKYYYWRTLQTTI